MPKIVSYRELVVYRDAFAAAMEVFRLSARFPVEERWSLTDQIRRSSRSVCAQIAEAWRKRGYPRAWTYKLSEAQAELDETRVWLDFAVACRYLADADVAPVLDAYDSIQTRLYSMATTPQKWTPWPAREPGRTAQEDRPGAAADRRPSTVDPNAPGR